MNDGTWFPRRGIIARAKKNQRQSTQALRFEGVAEFDESERIVDGLEWI
jgi:hypothetical protein